MSIVSKIILVIFLVANIDCKDNTQQVYKNIKLCQSLELDVFVCVEFEYVIEIGISRLLEADAPIWYPLNRVKRQRLTRHESTIDNAR